MTPETPPPGAPAALQLGPRVLLRSPTPADGPELLDVNRRSAATHRPWIFPPMEEAEYAGYLQRAARPDVAALLVVRREDSAVMGTITLSQIFYGPLCSAYCGYYIGGMFAGRGYMSEALGLALDHAFGPLGLHRVEANIQPGNAPSIALVRRLGFTREGFSRRYLRIDGDWRDHERWAILSEDWASRGT
jgi:ribosomal-protein-alanine N-acetyltransferase